MDTDRVSSTTLTGTTMDTDRVSSTTLVHGAKIWQWSDAAMSGPKEMLAAADIGEANDDFATWMMIDEEAGTINAIGRGAPPAALLAAATRVFNAGGRLILPGLQDAHIHAYMLGATSVQVHLEGLQSIEGCRGQGLRVAEA